MLPESGPVMVLVARLRDWPAVSVYGPAAIGADINVTGAVSAFGMVMTLASNATEPTRARALPSSVALVSSVMDCAASRVPLKTELPPIVAELPTCQKTLAALAPPLKMTWRPVVVTSVEAIWKIQTPFVSPRAFKVRSPEEISSEEVDL